MELEKKMRSLRIVKSAVLVASPHLHLMTMVMMVGMVLITLTRIDIDIDKQLDNMKRSAVWVISSVAPRQGVRLWPSAPSTEVWPQPCRPQPSRDDIDQDDNIP